MGIENLSSSQEDNPDLDLDLQENIEQTESERAIHQDFADILRQEYHSPNPRFNKDVISFVYNQEVGRAKLAENAITYWKKQTGEQNYLIEDETLLRKQREGIANELFYLYENALDEVSKSALQVAIEKLSGHEERSLG